MRAALIALSLLGALPAAASDPFAPSAAQQADPAEAVRAAMGELRAGMGEAEAKRLLGVAYLKPERGRTAAWGKLHAYRVGSCRLTLAFSPAAELTGATLRRG